MNKTRKTKQNKTTTNTKGPEAQVVKLVSSYTETSLNGHFLINKHFRIP